MKTSVYQVEEWSPDGETLLEVLSVTDDLRLASASFATAKKLRAGALIRLREGEFLVQEYVPPADGQ